LSALARKAKKAPGTGAVEPASRPGRRKARLDRLLVERGLAPSRERAQAFVLAGVVRVDGRPGTKPGALVPEESVVTVMAPDHPFVGRGGVKLAGALSELRVETAGRVALDIGSSTGGFSDCLLKRGALRVYAIDVGRGLLDWSLRNDARVRVMEGRNARTLAPGDLRMPFWVALSGLTVISHSLTLPGLLALRALGARGQIVP